MMPINSAAKFWDVQYRNPDDTLSKSWTQENKYDEYMEYKQEEQILGIRKNTYDEYMDYKQQEQNKQLDLGKENKYDECMDYKQQEQNKQLDLGKQV